MWTLTQSSPGLSCRSRFQHPQPNCTKLRASRPQLHVARYSEDPAPPRRYADYTIYKKSGAMQVTVLPPEWRLLPRQQQQQQVYRAPQLGAPPLPPPTAGPSRYELLAEGRLRLSLAAALPVPYGVQTSVGERRYDWQHKVVVCVRPSDLLFVEMLTEGGQETLVHDPPHTADTPFPTTQKELKVTANKAGFTFAASVASAAQEAQDAQQGGGGASFPGGNFRGGFFAGGPPSPVQVQVDANEFWVLKLLAERYMPHLMGLKHATGSWI